MHKNQKKTNEEVESVVEYPLEIEDQFGNKVVLKGTRENSIFGTYVIQRYYLA